MRACAACGYDATDSKGVLCTWCWETVIAGNAVACLGDWVDVGATDRDMALLATRFIMRAKALRGAAE
jgi:hypothetical protein